MTVENLCFNLASTHSYKLPFYNAAQFKKNLSLYAPITRDECHAWFHLYGLRRAATNARQAKILKCKILLHIGIQTHKPLIKRPTSYPYH